MTYWTIAKAAAIPAILYFAGIWIMTHLEAKRTGLKGLSDEEMPDRKEVLKKIYLLIPILVVVVLLFSGMSIMRAALWSIVSTVVVSAIRKDTRIGVKDAIIALAEGQNQHYLLQQLPLCAGIIVGVVTKTGSRFKISKWSC